MDNFKNLFTQRFSSLLEKNPTALSHLEHYASLLIQRTSKINLVSKNTLASLWCTHFLDALLPTEFIDFSDKNILDVGSGGGVPGIPIAIAYPDSMINLVEIIRKKALSLRYFIQELHLSNVQVSQQHFEDYVSSPNEQIDLVTCRAVRCTESFFSAAYEILRPGGKIILYKGPNIKNEIELLKKATQLFSYEIHQIHLFELGKRNIIEVSKHG